MDSGVETIGDDMILAQVRRQARRVHIKSLLTAAVCTAIALVV